MIRIEDIFVVYSSGTPIERIALRGINFTAQDGEVIALMGNVGAGRSTLLSFLAGHIKSSFGKLWLNKTDITNQSVYERSNIFSTVFYNQDVSTVGSLSVLENLVIANMHRQRKSILSSAVTAEIRAMFYEQLRSIDFLEIEEFIDEKVCNIPRIYRQALAIILSAVKETPVLLIDEHTAGLDRDSAESLLAFTKKVITSKKIITFMSVSDPKFALDVADKIVTLDYGQVVSVCSGDEKKKAVSGASYGSTVSTEEGGIYGMG